MKNLRRNLYGITIRSAQGYAQRPDIVRVRIPALDRSASGEHLLWPQLIGPDGLAGSNRLVDTPIVLRYSALRGETVAERAIVLYSGLAGPATDFAQSSFAAVFPNKSCPAAGQACWLGDYRYGSFIQKFGTTLTYFTPWTGQSGTMSVTGPHAHGAVIDVTP